MSTTLSNLNSLINDRRRDSGSNSIDMTSDGFRAINSTLDIWNDLHDWPWQIKKVQFNYNQGIDTYALDTIVSDFKFPLTLKYYKPAGKTIEFWLTSPLRFDSARLWSRRFAVDIAARIQTLRCKSVDGLNAPIETLTSYNNNGTWAGASAISSVATDNYEGYSLPTSVKFSFNGTSGTLTNSTIRQLDLSQYQDRSNIYLDVDFGSVSNLTSIALKWGTDSSNYYTVTATTDYLGQAFSTGWSRIKFAWNSPTTVGAPTVSQIKYAVITITCSGSTNLGTVRVQNLFVSENIPLELTYYSTNMAIQASDSTQYQHFPNSGNTSDTPMWTGRWDAVTEPFINSVLEIIFWMTGEYTDLQMARTKIAEIVTPLRARYPSQRRYPTMQIVADINYQPDSGGTYRDTNFGWE